MAGIEWVGEETAGGCILKWSARLLCGEKILRGRVEAGRPVSRPVGPGERWWWIGIGLSWQAYGGVVAFRAYAEGELKGYADGVDVWDRKTQRWAARWMSVTYWNWEGEGKSGFRERWNQELVLDKLNVKMWEEILIGKFKMFSKVERIL